jgi:hypothetical protein
VLCFALEYLGFDLFLAFNHMGMLFFREEEWRKPESFRILSERGPAEGTWLVILWATCH